jgi:hypothetical protein
MIGALVRLKTMNKGAVISLGAAARARDEQLAQSLTSDVFFM